MFDELVKKTRSYRNFDNSYRMSGDELTSLIELCRYTAATANLQSVKFAYAYKNEDCDKIFPHLGWAGYIKENKPPYKGNEPAAYILLCSDTRISREVIGLDIGICAQTIVLAAAERGIGACILGSMNRDAVSKIFSLDDAIKPIIIIALGKPKEEIRIVDAVDGNIKYYRDENDVHFVPKRPLGEILLPEIK